MFVFLQFILSFRLATDAMLHQKTKTQGRKPTLNIKAAKITVNTNNFYEFFKFNCGVIYLARDINI